MTLVSRPTNIAIIPWPVPSTPRSPHAADALIKDIWDEVEFALRRRAREWGVTYALRPGEPEETATPEPEA